MRVTSAFNKLLGLPGTLVESVSFSNSAVIVGVRMTAKLLKCPCGHCSRPAYDRSRRRWRHVDFGRWKILLEAEVRRVDCPACGQVRTECVPWARPGARHTTDFEDLAAWLAQRMAKRSVAVLLRTSWQTVDAIVARMVGQHLNARRLDGLCRIGIDEIAYRKGRKFLTVVADHDTGRVVWIDEGRSQAILNEFFDMLGEDGRSRIEEVSMDMGRIYREATDKAVPYAMVCFDPFHVVKWAGDAVDQTLKATPRPAEGLEVEGITPGKAWQKLRASLRAAREKLDPTGEAILAQLEVKQEPLHRAWQLKESLRELYQKVHSTQAGAYLKRWCATAAESGIPAFVNLARRIRHNMDGIVSAVHYGLSNSLVEGLNAGIRLIQRRAHGYASLNNLISMIYLCHGGITTRTPSHLI